MQQNEEFNNYVELYKKLPLNEKKVRVNNEMKKLLAFISKVNSDLNIDNSLLYNKEILALSNEDISDEDFVEAMFVYTHSIQEAIGKYFNEVSKILYK